MEWYAAPACSGVSTVEAQWQTNTCYNLNQYVNPAYPTAYSVAGQYAVQASCDGTTVTVNQYWSGTTASSDCTTTPYYTTIGQTNEAAFCATFTGDAAGVFIYLGSMSFRCPTPSPLLEVATFDASVSYGEPWPIALTSCSGQYGSSSVQLTGNANAAASPATLSLTMTPYGIEGLESASANVQVSYGEPWQLQLDESRASYGSSSITCSGHVDAYTWPADLSIELTSYDIPGLPSFAYSTSGSAHLWLPPYTPTFLPVAPASPPYMTPSPTATLLPNKGSGLGVVAAAVGAALVVVAVLALARMLWMRRSNKEQANVDVESDQGVMLTQKGLVVMDEAFSKI